MHLLTLTTLSTLLIPLLALPTTNPQDKTAATLEPSTLAYLPRGISASLQTPQKRDGIQPPDPQDFSVFRTSEKKAREEEIIQPGEIYATNPGKKRRCWSEEDGSQADAEKRDPQVAASGGFVVAGACPDQKPVKREEEVEQPELVNSGTAVPERRRSNEETEKRDPQLSSGPANFLSLGGASPDQKPAKREEEVEAPELVNSGTAVPERRCLKVRDEDNDLSETEKRDPQISSGNYRACTLTESS
jgi:hypothetical protein